MRTAEHPAPERILLHLSDTHLRGPGPELFGSIDTRERLARAVEAIERAGTLPDAIIVTGDVADLGEASAYDAVRAILEPFAERLGARLLWVMGNHDDRAGFRERLLDERAEDASATIDRVDELDGLRVVTLDTSVPGAHHGEVTEAQLAWLADVLSVPAPLGTIIAMHHPPVPSVLALAASVELRDQQLLANVVRGRDVRAIIAGHLHYSTFASFAGIPVSVASATCYTQDLTVPVGGTRPQDGAQSFNLIHVYDDTIVHSIVPVDAPDPLEYIDPVESRRRLALAGVDPDSVSVARRSAPTEPLPVLR